ncbi:carbon storage regulator, CsrA [Paenibacillus tianmuensis]|uniref:Translational regulator CsrA n=1 Tax=Paenibacillus tianmuensis TaxID=624147 RepID=A0A1G4RP49_9BACL|nr:carbon storage regulator CsrA [Paenibacillus tianmuensis]SCW58570.1 carbon storage regulator, CsrA [Paenibacillus tianmuensis]
MLILTRKKGQSIVINNNIEIVISAIDGDQVKIGIVAPSEVNVLRKEVYLAVQQSNREAASPRINLAELKKITRPK